MSTVYKISGDKIKSPPIPGEIETYNVTYSGRTADGNMKLEFIAKKRKLIIRYPAISGEDMRQLEKLLYDGPLFFEVEFPDGNGQQTMTAYVGALKKIPARHDNGVWHWKDLEISLIEQ